MKTKWLSYIEQINNKIIKSAKIRSAKAHTFDKIT